VFSLFSKQTFSLNDYRTTEIHCAFVAEIPSDALSLCCSMQRVPGKLRCGHASSGSRRASLSGQLTYAMRTAPSLSERAGTASMAKATSLSSAVYCSASP
jgi:hypothetical protein